MKNVSIKLINIFKNALYLVIGSIFVVIGAISLLFPFIPGFLLIFVGLFLLAEGSERVKRNGIVKRFFNKIKLKFSFFV